MGIFTRVRDIISSNLNTMLDKAEDPQKLVKLMIREMEDTLVEIKASCAGVMANKKKVTRAHEEAGNLHELWTGRAEQAVEKGREDLARAALLEKRRYLERVESLERELAQCEDLVAQYQSDIVKLEERLAAAREKQRTLVQRHIHAQRKKQAETDIRKMETSGVFARFDQFENRIERMESEAELVNYGRKPTLEEQFANLQSDEDIEKELDELRAKKTGSKAKPEGS